MGGTSQPMQNAAEVSGEHDIQLQLLAALEDAVRRGRTADEVASLLDQLIDYTNVHFHSEELMMRLYAFPQYDAHRNEHAALMEQVCGIRERFEKQDQAGLLELVAELRDWLGRHIDGKDRGFATFLGRQAQNLL